MSRFFGLDERRGADSREFSGCCKKLSQIRRCFAELPMAKSLALVHHLHRPENSGLVTTLFLLGKQGMSTRTGGCLCGQVRYKLGAEPLVSRICWCRDCQRIAGNGTVNAIFPSAAIEVSGTTTAYTSTADSGNQITRHFCPQCGAHLFADSSGRPGFSVVRLGTLDDPSSIRPQANIWTASAPAWACLDAVLEQFDGQPAPTQVTR